MADRICVMNHGRIEQIGSPQRGLLSPGQRVRRALLRRQQPRSMRPLGRHRRRGDTASDIALGTFRCAGRRRRGADGGRRQAARCRPEAIAFGDSAATANRLRGPRRGGRASSGRVSQVRVSAAAKPDRGAADQAAEPRRRAAGRGRQRGEVSWSERRMSASFRRERRSAPRRRASALGPCSDRRRPSSPTRLPVVFILVPLGLFLAAQLLLRRSRRPIVHELTLAQLRPLLHRRRSSCRSSSAPASLCLAVAAISRRLRLSGRLSAREPRGPPQIRAGAGLRRAAADELHHQDLRDPQHPRRQRLPQPHPALASASSTQPSTLPRLQPQRRHC